MHFEKTLTPLFNRGSAPEDFLEFIVKWARDAPNEIFELNNEDDVYSHVSYKFGPWKTGDDFLVHRKAVMLEVLRTLCGFESSWNWTEGIDLSANNGNSRNRRSYLRHEREWEAGILQASSNTMSAFSSCANYAEKYGISKNDHSGFRVLSMKKGIFPIQYGALILRETHEHHGPLNRIEHSTNNGQLSSIHPYMLKECVAEFEAALKS